MKILPLKNHLLVQIVKKENETKSGIILVGGDSEATNEAQVIEISDSYDEEGQNLFKGDKILIEPQVGTKVKVEGEEYLIIHQKDVFAIIRD